MNIFYPPTGVFGAELLNSFQSSSFILLSTAESSDRWKEGEGMERLCEQRLCTVHICTSEMV